jgi:TatD DNase family protein
MNHAAGRPTLIDTHIHFDDDRFDADRPGVYDRATRAGVCAMVIPATVQSRWVKVQSLAREYHNVHASFGLHPLFCDQHKTRDLQQLPLQLNHGVAIGECGLDKQKDTTDFDTQRYYFDAQIEIAKEIAKPLIIHARNSVEQVILMLRQAGFNLPNGNGVVHSFNGSVEQAHRLIDIGFKLSFGGPVTFPNARKIHHLIETLPLHAIMLETDAPDQPGAQHRGARNEPQWLPEVLHAVATLRTESPEHIAATSNNNARRLFGLSKDTR